MKDYVSREALIALARPGTFETSCDGATRREDAVPVRVIQGVPSANVVEVVRCHECVHHVGCGYYFCNMWCANCPDDSDFFCAYGERDGGVKDAAD